MGRLQARWRAVNRAYCPRIRPAVAADCPDVAAIAHERDGVAVSDAQLRCELDLADGGRLLLVARVEGELVAFGRAARWDAPAPAPATSAPSGWYLFGVIVRDRWRRHGIALELTRRRLEWISERAGEAYYFANSRNGASIDLHAKLGFTELSRDFTFPGASFEGGKGILFRVELAGHLYSASADIAQR
jgi:ribosomal protein S18 acetylase RimI-like enzyme